MTIVVLTEEPMTTDQQNPAEDGKPTVRAVIAHAERMRTRADALMVGDPWARPYYPTTATARKLSQQYGPEAAIATLDDRWARALAKQRDDDERSDRAAARHERHQRRAHRDREASRADLTVGQRIDAALAQLSVVQAAPAATAFDTEPVTDGGGGKDDSNPVPKFPGDPAAKARSIARKAVREIEGELEEAERRLLPFERSAA